MALAAGYNYGGGYTTQPNWLWTGSVTTSGASISVGYPGVTSLPSAPPVERSPLAWLDDEIESLCKLART